MFEEIKIIDGSIRASIFIRNNNIYVYSNKQSFDVEKYINNLKQYSLDELCEMSQSTILYKGKGKSNKKKRNTLKLVILGIVYTLTLVAASLIVSNNIDNYNIRAVTYQDAPIADFETTDLYHSINTSTYLTEEEKAFLYNEDFLSDVVDTINYDNNLKRNIGIYFNNIKIESFSDDTEDIEKLFGYYDTEYPSTIFIRDYDELTDVKKDVIAHEFVHLCQDVMGYNLIIEASAEIISNEYYNTPVTNYLPQVKLLKKLMEIIGPEPIWNYCFTGDFTSIEERVRPFLTEEEYQEFLNDLTFDYDDIDKNIPKFESLDRLLSKLYSATYDSDINDNIVITLINNDNRTLSRYYFNKRFINQENSYYLSYAEGNTIYHYNIRDAIINGNKTHNIVPIKMYLPPTSEIYKDMPQERKLIAN